MIYSRQQPGQLSTFIITLEDAHWETTDISAVKLTRGSLYMYSLLGRPKVQLELIMPVTLRNRLINSVPSSAPLASPAGRPSSTLRGMHVIEVPDPNFHNFDTSRTEKEIKPGQIWAIYDDKDGMPRYYGRINSVSLSPFSVQFWWLVCDERSSEESALWTSKSGYYVAAGEFENGEYTTRKIVNMFSHRMYVKEQFVRGGEPSRMKIYPRKGDVWAMYRDWDEVRVLKSTERSPQVTCKFDLVEVLVDYSKENGVKTVKLAKLHSFRTVFQQQDGLEAIHVWRTADLLRFSHTVPAVKIKPNKLLSIPKQALELDPAAIPPGYTEPGNGLRNMQMKSQAVDVEDARDIEVKVNARDMEVKMNQRKGYFTRQSSSRQQTPMLDVVGSELVLCQGNAEIVTPRTGDSGTEVEEMAQRPQLQESLTVATIVKSVSHSSSELNALKNLEIESKSDFYDFSHLRTERDIEAGQIWAIYDEVDKMPRSYARVIRVLESPFQVEVWRLKFHPCAEKMQSWTVRTGLSVSCGRFKNDHSDMMGLERFSHQVQDRAKGRVKIYPRKGEVWAMYRNWDLERGGRQVQILGRLHINGYDLVEILADFVVEGSLEIVRLAKVIGFKSLFQRQGKPIVKSNVGPDLLFEFSHSIPARRMYKDDTLRIPFGAVEVDPACSPQHSSPVPVMATIAPHNGATM